MLFQLARHPHIWAKLRETALKLSKTRTPLAFEILKSLENFRYFCQETLRSVGSAARVWRVATRDTVLPANGRHFCCPRHASGRSDAGCGARQTYFGVRKPMGSNQSAGEGSGHPADGKFERLENCDPVYKYMENHRRIAKPVA
ncbi:hypothetical protein OIDMADRAFT_26455 [Oidiodendron maius Zn]|uniref:Uncharacterized protein n=1 Tax=Oidiodendron maius (strain Zn) TaxID=913774 RepID=A0A0C3HNA3_OIDMZ|nr:hypothetical protein OIDMADRAFT_26455 [Oidiodendron maius Zn]